MQTTQMSQLSVFQPTMHQMMPGCLGEVRFEQPSEAQTAMKQMNGTFLNGGQIFVQADPNSQDRTRLIVHGLVPGTQWQEVKDHFKAAGEVAFAEVHGSQQAMPVFQPMLMPSQRRAPARMPLTGLHRWGAKAMLASSPSGGKSLKGEVRFDSPLHAQVALSKLNGSQLKGRRIQVAIDVNSQDQSKVIITNLGPDITWQDLKDHFSKCGQVAFAAVKVDGSGGISAARAMMMGQLDNGCIGEVRFEQPAHAKIAMKRFNGIEFGDNVISVALDMSSQDGSKLLVQGLSSAVRWTEIKDFFGTVGPVAFAEVYSEGQLPPSSSQGGGHKRKVVSEEDGTGEVRYANPVHAQLALKTLNGKELGGAKLTLLADPTSQDQSKLIITDLPAGVEWQELKDHFSQVGEVAYAGVLLPGEVRFEKPEDALAAIAHLDGAVVDGATLRVKEDPSSQDKTKLIVEGLPAAMKWQELKDLFSTVGTVKFADRPCGR